MPSRPESRAERARKTQAADWFARMRGPDADVSRLDFERWRAGDPGNRVAYARLEALWQESAALAGTDLGRAPVFVRRQSILALTGPRLVFASIALAVLGAAGALLWWPGGRDAPAVVQVAPRFETAIGEIRSMRLADGSTVTLDADSAIEVSLSGTARRVRLTRGRARFDVAAEPGRAFIVEAGGQIVTARGTTFDVGLCRDGVRVTLLRGSVDVRGGGSPSAGARLLPGQSLAAGPGAASRVAAAPAGGDQWVSGMLSYEDAPIEAVLEEANRYSTHKLRLGSPVLARLRVTGAFRARPTDELAAALAAAFSLRVGRAPNGDFVLRER